MMSDQNERPFSAASFNQFLNERKLMGSRCEQCGTVYLPPRAICPACHSDRMGWVQMSGKGNLSAFTSIAIAPTFMIEQGYGRDNPYVSGIVELEEGVKISARILGVEPADPGSIQIGIPLRLDFIETGDGKTQIAFSV